MNNNSNRRKNKGKKGNQPNRSRYTNFASPSYGLKMQTSTRATLTAYVQLNSTLGTNGFNATLNWPSFQGGNQLSDNYQYFEVTGWRCDVTLPTVDATTDSFYSGAIAVYPQNYLLDGIVTYVPTDPRDVLLLPGAVNIKEGLPNKGRWFPPTCKQVYPMYTFTPGRTNLACLILGYFNDIGVNETAAVLEIYVDIVAYGLRFQTASVQMIQLFPSAPAEDSCEEIDDSKSTRALQVAKRSRPPSKR